MQPAMPLFCYCLFCETARCRSIAAALMDKGVFSAISPQVVQRHRKQGRLQDVAYDLLPGYIFLYSPEPLDLIDLTRGMRGVIRRLGSRAGDFALTQGDAAFAMNIYRRGGVLGDVQIISTGDEVVVDDPLFEGRACQVLHVDGRKQRAKLSYTFDGQSRTIWVSCDLIRPAKPTGA